MAQKKTAKKKVGDLAPKKDAKGGRQSMDRASLNKGNTSLNRGGASLDRGSQSLNAPNQGAF